MDVDAGAEGEVDGRGEVGGEEDDAFEVLEFAEEDWGLSAGNMKRKKGKEIAYWIPVHCAQCLHKNAPP